MKAETFKVLEQAGVPARQAWAIGRAVEYECATAYQTLATKLDLADLRVDLVRWLFLLILSQTAVLAAAGYFYINLLMR